MAVPPASMRGLWLDEGLSYRTDLAVPVPAPGEARVRVICAGICNTDQELVKGYMGFRGVPGHEFVGIVEEAATCSLVGRRVVGEINCGCGACPLCRAGDARHCAARTCLGIVGRNGAFAEYLVLPEHNLHTVPDGLATDEAVFVEPVAAAFEIPDQVALRPTDRVVVLGDGKLGLLTAQVLALTRCRLRLVGKHADKLEKVKGAGIETVLLDDWLASPELSDVVVDCTGASAGFDLALRATRPRGTLVLKTTVADAPRVDLAPVVINEIRIVGSRCGPFEPALRALADRSVDVRALVSDRFDLSQGLRAFDRSHEPGVVKVLLDVPPAG